MTKREKILYLYSCALEDGDYDTIADIWAQAEHDSTLTQDLLDLEQAQQETMDIPSVKPVSLSLPSHMLNGHGEASTPIHRVPAQPTLEEKTSRKGRHMLRIAVLIFTLVGSLLGYAMGEEDNTIVQSTPIVSATNDSGEPSSILQQTDRTVINAGNFNDIVTLAMMDLEPVYAGSIWLDDDHYIIYGTQIDIFSTDGQLLNTIDQNGSHLTTAYNHGLIATYSNERQIDVINADTLETVYELALPYRYAGDLQFSPDGKYLAATSVSNTDQVIVWDMDTGKIFRVFNNRHLSGERIRFTPNSRYIAISGDLENQQGIVAYDLTTGGVAAVWDTNTDVVTDFEFHPTEPLMVSVSAYGSAEPYVFSTDMMSDSIQYQFQTPNGGENNFVDAIGRIESPVISVPFTWNNIEFSPDGSVLYANPQSNPNIDAYVAYGFVWDEDTSTFVQDSTQTLTTFQTQFYSASRIDINNTGLALIKSPVEVGLVNLATMETEHVMPIQTEYPSDITSNADATNVVIEYIGGLSVWNTISGELSERHEIDGPFPAYDFMDSESGTLLMTGSYDNQHGIYTWDSTTNTVEFLQTDGLFQANQMQYNAENNSMRIIGMMGMRDVDIATGDMQPVLSDELFNQNNTMGFFTAPQFELLDNGDIVIKQTSHNLTVGNQSIYESDPSNYEAITLSGHVDLVYDMELSTDQTRLVSGDYGSQLIVWDTATWEPVHELNLFEAGIEDELSTILTVSISRENDLVLFTSLSHLYIWDLTTNDVQAIEGGFFGSFSDDGTTITVINRDNTVNILGIE